MFDFKSICLSAGYNLPPGVSANDSHWSEDNSEDYERIQKAFDNLGLAADWLEEIDNEGLAEEVEAALHHIGKAFSMLKEIL